MAFQIIKAETRTQRMIDWFSGICQAITDFLPGSKIRSKFETIAIEMEAQDFAFYQTVRKAIPVSNYTAFNFNLLAAVKAAGKVVLGAAVAPAADIAIPKGTRIKTLAAGSTAAKEYETQADSLLPIGQTAVTVNIICTTAGQVGNTPANTIVAIAGIPGIDTATNTQALENGADRETEDARRVRFQRYITTLSRGTNAAVEYGAMTTQLVDEIGNITERVATAKVVEPFIADTELPAGNIICYVHNGVGDTSSDLVEEAQKIVDGYVTADGTKVAGYKAAGVVCTVDTPTEDATDVTMTITAANTLTDAEKAQLQIDVTAAIIAHIRTLSMGQALLLSNIISIAKHMTGVYNVGVAAPAEDQEALDSHIIIPGTITVTVE